MSHKIDSYKTLFRIVGSLLIVVGLYFALHVIFVFVGAGDNVSGVLIEMVGPFGGSFPNGGVLVYISLGLFFFSLSSMNVRIIYWNLQAMIWLIGINLWYQQNNETEVRLITPFATPLTFGPQIEIAAICSLLLFLLYFPLKYILEKFFESMHERQLI